jgi:hypothetical protein
MNIDSSEIYSSTYANIQFRNPNLRTNGSSQNLRTQFIQIYWLPQPIDANFHHALTSTYEHESCMNINKVRTYDKESWI